MSSSVRASRIALVLALAVTPVLRAQARSDVGTLAAFQLQVRAAYGLHNSHPGGLPVVVENERVAGAATEQTPLGFLPAHLRLQTRTGTPDPRPTPGFTLKPIIAAFPESIRAAARLQSGANQFISPWVVVIADPRASIRWTPAIADKSMVGCRYCERPARLINKTEADGVYEMWAHGRSIVISGRPGLSTTYEYLGQQRRLETLLPSVVADTVRIADRLLPSKTPPFIGTQAVNNVLMHSGELVRDAVDLSIKGRGFDFVLQRFYSSAVYSFGPLGRNFDSPLFARVRFEPDGSLSYYDGTGRVDHFERAGNEYIAPHGVFLDIRGSGDSGVVVRYPDGTMLFFDQLGRLLKMRDRNVTSSDESDGNVMRFTYNAEGRLASVVDATNRTINFAYYSPTAAATGGASPGLLSTVTDFDGRVVRYEYDAYGRLVKVTGPDPQSTRSEQQITTYGWGPPPTSGNFRLDVLRSGQITSERDGEGRTVYTATYASGDAWRVETLTSGGGTWTYTHTASAMTVTDPNGHPWKYTFDDAGRVTAVEEPGGATTQRVFDGEGRLASIIRPMGTQTPLTDAVTYTYDPPRGRDRRSMLNVATVAELPRAGSAEAVAGATRTTTIHYDALNLPISIAEPGGATTTIHRDNRGNPKTITDATGVTATLDFDAHGQLKRTTDPRVGTTTYTYVLSDPLKRGYIETTTTNEQTTTYKVDNRGNVVLTNKPGEAPVTHVVNRLDQLEEESSPSAKKTYSYDAAGSLTAQNVLAGTDAAGNPVFSSSTFQIDELGRVHQRTEDGRVTTYGYDAAGNLKSVTAPASAPVIYTYDTRNQLTVVSEGTRNSTFGYDLDGVQSTITNTRGKTTTLLLDGFGNPVGQIDPAGITETRTTDPAGRPLDMRIIKQVSVTERYVLRWTQFAYDAAGRLIRDTRKRFDAPLRVPASGDPTGATDVVTQTIYDDANRKVTSIDPRGNATITHFDDAGRIASVTDAAGNVVATTYTSTGSKHDEKVTEKQPDGTTRTYTTRYEYDAENRLIGTYGAAGEFRPENTFVYDSRGNISEQTDALGRTTRFEYDLRGNKVKETDPEGGVTVFRYDAADRLELLKDPNGNETTFTYDDFGNLLTEKRADGAAWTHTYDANNNRETTTDPNGTVIVNTYDDLDRLTVRTIAKGANVVGPSRVTFTRDDLGRITASTTDEGVQVTTKYDSLGNISSETLQIASGPARTVTNAYDLVGNLETRTYPSGLVLTQSFTPLNRLAAVRQGSSALVTYIDAGSRLTTRTLVNGITGSWSYDPTGRLSSIVEKLADDVLRHVVYERSPAGRKDAIVRGDLAKRWSYDYNRNGWTTTEQLARTETTTNALLRSTRYTPDKTLNYRRVDRLDQTTGTAVTTSIETVVNNRNQYTTFGGRTLTYDRNGNLRTYGNASLQYDYANRLAEITLADGTEIVNLRDEAGRKLRSVTTRNGTHHTTDYVLAGDQVLEEYDDGKLYTRYVRGRGIDEIVRAERSSNFDGELDQLFFPLQDELGNVDQITDAAGATLERYEYEGYGTFRVLTPVGADQSSSAYGWKWLFQGREYLHDLSAYDFRARTLWPELGRFGQEDPEGFIDSPNPYQALLGDFNGATDPTGRWTVKAPDLTSMPALDIAMKKAKVVYDAAGLQAVYKNINSRFKGDFLSPGKPPNIFSLGETTDYLGWTNPPNYSKGPGIALSSLLVKYANLYDEASAGLVITLLHEQAHFENTLSPKPQPFVGGNFKVDGGGYYPLTNELGNQVENMITGGTLNGGGATAKYDYKSERVMIMAFDAGSLSLTKQHTVIRSAHRRLLDLFGSLQTVGVVYDRENHRVYQLDPRTGKKVPKP